MNRWKTTMYQSEISAQAKYSRTEERRHTIETLESLIRRAYQTGNQTLEQFWRHALGTYESGAYGL